MERKNARDIGLHEPQPRNYVAWSHSSLTFLSMIHFLFECQILFKKGFDVSKVDESLTKRFMQASVKQSY